MINVGIIGLGKWGEKLLRVFNNNCRVVFASSHNKQKANLEKEYPNVTFKIRQYENLIKQSNVDAIVVATPTKYHKSIIEICATYKKHVFVEKPLAANINECNELKKNFPKDRVLFVGHIFLYHPCYLKLIDHVGKRNISSVYASWGKMGSFKSDFLLEILPHDISLGISIFNGKPFKIKKLFSFGLHSDSDHFLLELKYKKNKDYKIEINRISNINRRFMRFQTSDEEIFIWDNDSLLYFNKNKNAYETFFKSDQEPLQCEIQEFLSCLENSTVKSDFSFSNDVISVIEDINNYFL